MTNFDPNTFCAVLGAIAVLGFGIAFSFSGRAGR